MKEYRIVHKGEESGRIRKINVLGHKDGPT